MRIPGRISMRSAAESAVRATSPHDDAPKETWTAWADVLGVDKNSARA